jgi:hypothetical protein
MTNQLKEGTDVTITYKGYAKGVVCGVSSSLDAVGHVYIIKLTYRGDSEYWKNFPYSCVALPESLFMYD